MVSLLFILLAAQDTETIPRAHRFTYETALGEYRGALLLLESDPKGALDTLEKVFANQKVDKKDRLIRFEFANGRFTNPGEFFPNQARGRIRIALARSDPKNATTLLAAAVQDFKASADAGVKASEAMQKNAKTMLDRLKASKTSDPPKEPHKDTSKEAAAVEAFREAWFKLIEDHHYKSARDYIDAKGGALSADKKKEFAAETETHCRKYVAQELESFVKAVEVNRSSPALRAMKPADFARAFGIPSESEIVGTYPEIGWARSQRDALERLRTSDPRPSYKEAETLLDLLLAQMASAEPILKSNENRYFKAAYEVAFRYVEEVLQSLAGAARDEPPETRRADRAEAMKIRDHWVQSFARYPRDFLARNGANERRVILARILEQFPVDVGAFDNLEVVDACLQADAPDEALQRLIDDIGHVRDQPGARLTRDSSRKLLTELMAATAIRDLLAGKGVDDAAKGLRDLGKALGPLGGPLEPARWGPKIEKIFASAR